MLTLSKYTGTGGYLKGDPEDFIVREITKNGTELQMNTHYSPADLSEENPTDGKFTTFVLQKKNWDTNSAILEIAKKLRRGRKSVSYSGSKDKTSISVQLASIFGVKPEDVMRIHIKDISINGAWQSNGLKLGDNLGNAFNVKISETKNPENAEKIFEELNGRFPNYFDKQRFGYRLNNPKIGMLIIRNDMKGAVMSLLTDPENESNEAAREARERLSMEMDFKSALSYFPRYLRSERSMLSYLSRFENYTNAIRAMPRGVSLFFIHSVESLIFNMALERMVRENNFESTMYCDADGYGFYNVDSSKKDSKGIAPVGNLVGYETNKGEITCYENEAMEFLGITPEDFRIRHLPELSMRGSKRSLMAPVKGLSSIRLEDGLTVNFSLQSGSYATILLNEITKSSTFKLDDILSMLDTENSSQNAERIK